MKTGPIKSIAFVALGAAGMCLAAAPASAQFAGFGPPTILSAGLTDNPSAVVIGDYDGDGFNDLAVVYKGTGRVAIFKNNGDGTFVPFPFFVNNAGLGLSAIVTGDLDQDNDLDLATANIGGDNVSILKNDGVGVFTIFGSAPVVDAPQSIAIGDLNGDGAWDMVTVNKHGSAGVSVYLNTGLGLQALDLNSDGVVDGSDLAALLIQWGTNGHADLNNDGVVNGADLATLLVNWRPRAAAE